MRDLCLYEPEEMPKQHIGDWAGRHSVYHERNVAKHGGELRTDKQRRQAIRGYYASITQVDRAINRILGTLREEGLSDHTWILFTSDHGDNMGDHRLWFKSNFTQGACRIPFIVTPPILGDLDEQVTEGWTPGQVSDAPIGLQDVLPTILDIAGVPIPATIDGRSLLPLVREPVSEPVRDVILGEFGRTGERSLMLTDGKWKYIWFEEDGVELLFHIAEDANELYDLCANHPQQLLTWRQKLVQILAQRQEDPAIHEGELTASFPGKSLTTMQKARMVSDSNPRGQH